MARSCTRTSPRLAARRHVIRLVCQVPCRARQTSRRREDETVPSEQLTVAVLFCDLRGFTPLAARLDPARVHELLSCYYLALSPVVFAHSGTVLQYTGDEIFAVFVASDSRTDAADSALAAAVDMFRHLAALNDELEARELPPLHLGIGLHIGEVVTANIGYGDVRQHTVIGDPVNVGRRFCSLAEAGQIALSDAFRRACRRAPMNMRRRNVELKGIKGVTLAHVIGAEDLDPRPDTTTARPVMPRTARRRPRRTEPAGRGASAHRNRGPPPRNSARSCESCHAEGHIARWPAASKKSGVDGVGRIERCVQPESFALGTRPAMGCC